MRIFLLQKTLINAVSASLIRAPDFRQKADPVRRDLAQMADSVSLYDPEFVLKVSHKNGTMQHAS